MTIEVWRAIEDYEGYYEVSNLGRIRSLDRSHSCKSKGGVTVTKNIKGRVLVNQKNTHGYASVVLCKKGIHKTLTVHSIVLKNFIGPIPAGMEACHNDGNKMNASLSNLRYDTYRNNNADKKLHGTHAAGERNPMAKLSNRNIIDIRARHKNGERICEIAMKYHVSSSTISVIIKKKTWQTI